MSGDFPAYLKKIGLPKIRFHDLRHTHATHLLESGIHPKIVAERLGHSSTRVTMDTYSHVLPHMQEQAVNELEHKFNRNKKPAN
ncbi:MAG: site-specific integrase [Bacillota bacterium]